VTNDLHCAGAVGISSWPDWSRWLDRNGGVAWVASSITLWQTAFTLARFGASVAINDIAIIAFLSDSSIPFSVTATSWSSTAGDDVWKTRVSVTICLSTGEDDTVGDSNSLETVYTDRWVDRESFVNRAAPVGKVGIGESVDCWGRCDDVNLVIAGELTSNFESSEVRKSINIGHCDVVIVLRE
jgi:hypothetical protein